MSNAPPVAESFRKGFLSDFVNSSPTAQRSMYYSNSPWNSSPCRRLCPRRYIATSLPPPPSEREHADAEERRSFLLTYISVVSRRLGGGQRPKSSDHRASSFSRRSSSCNPAKAEQPSPNNLTRKPTTEKTKTPRLIASGSLCVSLRAGYFVAGTARAAFAALAALFFARLTFAQRFC
jgi:hypothetical protein